VAGLDHSTLSAQLNSLYNTCHSEQAQRSEESAFLPTMMTKDDLEKLVEKMIRRIFDDQGFTGSVEDDMVKYYADQYWKATTEGFGQDLSTVDLNTPDYKFLQRLQEDVWHFAAAKNYTELKAISNELIGPDNKLREFKDFQIAAMQISDEHNNAWLRTEYNFAVASGQMGAKWQTIEEGKIDLPLLKYVTVGDDRVRPAHRALEGVTRPVDDKFWNTYYPPNGWNCRCTVFQLTGDEEATLLKDIEYPDEMPSLFKGNLGKSGLIFPPSHPYYTGLPDDVRQRAQELLKKYE
jgi:SPP1 gp7 family putative phage head morphogenesis protein